MKKLITISIIAFQLSASFAQETINDTTKQDVVYLKNGSIIRGKITNEVPNKTVTIKTKDESIFVYKKSEIIKISKANEEGQKENTFDISHLIYVPESKYQSWKYGGQRKSIAEIQNIMFDTGDPEIQSLVTKAKKNQKRQYIGIVAIPFGIAAISFAIAANFAMETVPVTTTNSNGTTTTTNRYKQTTKSTNELITAGACVLVVPITIVIGSNAKHKKNVFRRQAVELFNQQNTNAK